MNQVATLNEIRVVHRKIAVKTSPERIVARANRWREGRARRCCHDGAEFPSAPHIGRQPGLGTRNIPNESSHQRLTNVKVACSNPVRFDQEERHGD